MTFTSVKKIFFTDFVFGLRGGGFIRHDGEAVGRNELWEIRSPIFRGLKFDMPSRQPSRVGHASQEFRGDIGWGINLEAMGTWEEF